MGNIMRLALCQMKVKDSKQGNIETALDMLAKAKAGNADMAVLPEMFNCPYENSSFGRYAEEGSDGITVKAIANASRDLKMTVIAGTIPELEAGRLYNTCFVFRDDGSIIGRYRKMHLFDIDLPGKISFRESDTLTAGNRLAVFETKLCTVGVAICYDLRFPELFRLMALKGAKLIIVPGAFNMVTGPVHWEPLIRVRAIDNQAYVAAVSPARDESASYVAFGNSMAADPWGTVLARAGGAEEIVFADIDLNVLESIRNELPLLKHRRNDMYEIRLK